jgi:hypothetical protein
MWRISLLKFAILRLSIDSTELTLQSDHQKYFGGLFWVIKRNYQLRWISVFLKQEKGWPELESNQRHKDFQTCKAASKQFFR